MKAKLLVGTSKGLIIFSCSNQQWLVEKVHFAGLPVSITYIDERTHTWWVGLSHRHWGEKLHFSNDEGKTWSDANIPSYQNYFYKEGIPTSLKRIWVLQHAGVDRPNGMWLGTEPGGLFYSDDNGKSFLLIESLWDHPSRKDEKQWFGAGKDYPFIHSIVLDPNNSDHLYIGISCAGIFETNDGGQSWHSRNKGLKATYLPNPTAEMGHDPHRVMMCTQNTKTLWQQNHCGIFRSIDGGQSWNDVSGASGFPQYGFALAIDDKNENIAWVIPAQSDERRIPVDLKLSVCKTTDGGKTWKTITDGLPQVNAFDLSLRNALSRKDNILCFGTTNGNLYASHDEGESWVALSKNLASVSCVALT